MRMGGVQWAGTDAAIRVAFFVGATLTTLNKLAHAAREDAPRTFIGKRQQVRRKFPGIAAMRKRAASSSPLRSSLCPGCFFVRVRWTKEATTGAKQSLPEKMSMYGTSSTAATRDANNGTMQCYMLEAFQWS